MSALLMLGTFFQWFAGTKVGRIVGLTALVLSALFIAFLKVKAMGRAEEREKLREETEKLINDKTKLDEDIADDSDTDLNERVRPWIRKR